jgi:hypothetical protein
VVTGTVVSVVVVTGTVVTVVVVTGTVVTVVVVAGTVVVDRGSVVLVVVVEPRVVVVVTTVLLVVAVVVGGLAVVTTNVPDGTVVAVMSVVPFASVLTNDVMRPDPCTASVVVVDIGEVAVVAPADAARGAAAPTDVGNGTNGTLIALSARTGPSVRACR